MDLEEFDWENRRRRRICRDVMALVGCEFVAWCGRYYSW